MIDEISLTQDSVLERLNSVLEQDTRAITIPEKNIFESEIVAEPNFNVIATMNPGNDYGKRELTPALRNRFTEIWAEAVTCREYLIRYK